MTYKGVIKARAIQLDQPLPYPEGQTVKVSIEPVTMGPAPGSPAAVREGMHRPPHVDPKDVDALEAVIERGKLPVRSAGVLDADEEPCFTCWTPRLLAI